MLRGPAQKPPAPQSPAESADTVTFPFLQLPCLLDVTSALPGIIVCFTSKQVAVNCLGTGTWHKAIERVGVHRREGLAGQFGFYPSLSISTIWEWREWQEEGKENSTAKS